MRKENYEKLLNDLSAFVLRFFYEFELFFTVEKFPMNFLVLCSGFAVVIDCSAV